MECEFFCWKVLILCTTGPNSDYRICIHVQKIRTCLVNARGMKAYRKEEHYVNFSLAERSSISRIKHFWMAPGSLCCLEDKQSDPRRCLIMTVAPRPLRLGQSTENLLVKGLSCREALTYLTCFWVLLQHGKFISTLSPQKPSKFSKVD